MKFGRSCEIWLKLWKLVEIVKLQNLVEIVRFGCNCKIWLILWNLFQVVKCGWGFEIWLKLWSLVKFVKLWNLTEIMKSSQACEILWFGMICFCLEGSKSFTISQSVTQSVTKVGIDYRAVRAAKKAFFFQKRTKMRKHRNSFRENCLGWPIMHPRRSCNMCVAENVQTHPIWIYHTT